MENKLIIHRYNKNFEKYEELNNSGWRKLCSVRKLLPYGFFYPEYQENDKNEEILVMNVYVSPLSNIDDQQILNDFEILFNQNFIIDYE